MPNHIITDDGSQFTSGLFKSYYDDITTKICYAPVAYPRGNAQAERASAEVLKGLKTRSFRRKLKDWLRVDRRASVCVVVHPHHHDQADW